MRIDEYVPVSYGKARIVSRNILEADFKFNSIVDLTLNVCVVQSNPLSLQ